MLNRNFSLNVLFISVYITVGTMQFVQDGPSKKPFHCLSIRQQQRIKKRIKEKHISICKNNCDTSSIENHVMEIK